MDYSMSIYMDKKGNILIIPHAIDEFGIGRSVNRFVKIEKPYSNSGIGNSVKQSFIECMENPTIDSKSAVKVHELATGIKSYKAFSKDRLMVAGSFNQETGYTFMPWKRYPDGSYGLDKGEGIEFKAIAGATSEEIGSLIMKAFEAVNQLK